MSFLENLLPKGKTDNYFVVLGIEQHHITAIVAQINGTKVEVKGFGESGFTTEEGELEAADIALSTAEKDVPENVLVEQAIFTVNSNCIENNVIKPEYLKKIQKITKELDLKPKGFIEYPEALALYLEKQEESAPTAILLAIDKNQLIFSLLRVGKIQQTIAIHRSESIVLDFEHLLPKLEGDILPSRIILYDHQENLEQLKEDLLSFAWQKHPSFLHTPKIEILPAISLFSALVEAASSSFLKEFTLDEHILENVEKTPPSVSPLLETDKTPDSPSPHMQTVESDNLVVPDEAFGFVKGSKEQYLHTTPPPQEEKESEVIADKKPFAFPQFNFPSFGKIPIPKKLIPVFIPVFLVIFFAGVLFYFIWFSHKVTVALVVYPVVSSQPIDIFFSSKTVDEKNTQNTIPASEQSQQVDGTKTATTSGKISIGEKAKGEITIFNKTLGQKTFQKGTTVLHNNLAFTIDTEVSIASASDTGEGLTFGKNTINVTAADIGPDSNLASGTSFTLKDFPDNSFSAKNNQDFTGGSSREVPSVSKTDETRLTSLLTSELTSRAKTELTSQLSTGEKLIDSLIKTEVISKKMTPPVGTEAKESTLSLTLKITAYSYKEEDLQLLSQKIVVSAPIGFSSDQNQTSVIIDNAQLDKNGTILAKGKVNAYFLPSIDTSQIQTQLPGKTIDQVFEYLSSVPHVGGVRVFEDTPLFFLKNRIPLSKENVMVKIIPTLF